jgi:hypothetical protein
LEKLYMPHPKKTSLGRRKMGKKKRLARKNNRKK